MKWVAWQNVMTPKDLGGMGFGSLREASLAMMAKWWWRFKEDRDGLWRRVIWGLHNNTRSWNFIPVKLSMPGPWKQVAQVASDLEEMGLDLISMFRGLPGCQSQISFWKEIWLFEEPLFRKFPNLFEIETQKNAVVAERLKVEDGVNTVSFMWSRLPMGQVEETEINELLAALNSFTLGTGSDKWNWRLESLGIFSVKSLKKLIQQLSFTDLGLEFEWNKWCPIKVNFLVWRLIQDRIPTVIALQRRNVHLPSTQCKLCHEEEETTLHLFGSCLIAQ
ncbi:putative reverse transcriptase zinc-binding domain-containing protein [Helianthus annuus]|uniref:uncharacterized protein LOC110882366 n=1 Tax=Helianthus annuus TaxID=4232 RepID=UPI000B909C6A|nr:uncharacterized protein LOC110882366 [Helianthus annuus]KAJ0878916.1 putative reverse transcriptase zinc-binding domain-containing protein [Helianthus annuus]